MKKSKNKCPFKRYFCEQYIATVSDGELRSIIDEPYRAAYRRYLYIISHTYEYKDRKRNSSRHKASYDVTYMAYDMAGYPSDEQKQLFAQTFGNCRFLWNRMLSDYKKGIHRTPAQYKADPEMSWLKLSDSLALANVQLDLESAMSDYRSGNNGKPKFKKKGLCRDSYKTNCQYQNGKATITLADNILHLPKAGDIRVKCHRNIKDGGILKNVTVSHEPDGRWMFSVVYEYKRTETPVKPGVAEFLETGCANGLKVLGLDMSLPHLYVDSDGNAPTYTLTGRNGSIVSFDKHYRKLEPRIRKAQRELSRTKKHSRNHEKQALKVAKLHAKAKHQRHDFLRQIASRLAREYDIIGIEDLDMRAIKRSLRFGKSVSDNGWGLFVTYLEEACQKTGCLLLWVDKWFPSSKTCSHCGHVHKELQLSDRTYICPVCGHMMDRDNNAAINIRDEVINIFLQYHMSEPAA